MTLIAYSYSESRNTLNRFIGSEIQYNDSSGFRVVGGSDAINESKLTAFCMSSSEVALAKVWDNEEDEHWDSFPAE